MSEADQVQKTICQSYMKTVNASDAVAYSKLFTTDVIWMQPDAPIRHGREEIVADFGGTLETYKVDIEMTPGDTIQISEGCIYGISHVDGVSTEKASGSKSQFKFTVAQLIQKQESGEWLVKRQMWNNKPD